MARYTMRQRLVSVGEDFDITDEAGRPVYKVDGKVMRLREAFVTEDTQGREVATIREKKFALRESMNILRGGSRVATIRKARGILAPLCRGAGGGSPEDGGAAVPPVGVVDVGRLAEGTRTGRVRGRARQRGPERGPGPILTQGSAGYAARGTRPSPGVTRPRRVCRMGRDAPFAPSLLPV